MKNFLKIPVFLVTMAILPLDSEAKVVKFCENLDGAIANASVYKSALLEEPIANNDLKIAERFCNNTDVVDRLRVKKRKQVEIERSDGTKEKLEAYVWYKGYAKPVKVKYYYADAYLDGEPILLNFVLREETTVSKAEYQAAEEAARNERNKKR